MSSFFDRHSCLLFSSVGIALLSAFSLILCGVLVAHPGLWASGFQETSCTVEGHETSTNHSCDCSMGGDPTITCLSRYPCVLVNVSYNAINTNNETLEIHSIIYYTEITATFSQQCSFVPTCSFSFEANSKEVRTFSYSYGQKDVTYNCFYNPENNKEVIIYRQYTRSAVVASLLVPSLFLVVSLLILCCVFLCKS